MVEPMRFALIATDGVVAADGEFTEAGHPGTSRGE